MLSSHRRPLAKPSLETTPGNKSALQMTSYLMPFTLSHAGFVMPTHRSLSARTFCALLLGSLLPDTGYFIRQYDLTAFAHTAWGLLLFCLPLGLVLQLVVTRSFHHLVAPLPLPHRAYLRRANLSTPMRSTEWLALLAGAASHQFIDAFTHEPGQGVAAFPILTTEVFTFGGSAFPIFRLLQYGGSLVGLALLGLIYLRGLRPYLDRERMSLWQDGRGWVRLLGGAAISCFLALLLHLDILLRLEDVDTLRAFAFQFLTSWIPLGILVLVLQAFLINRHQGKE